MNPPFKMIVDTESEKYRHDTFWTKEPETIEWIKSFRDGETFCDIGANIGVYSLYAASLYPDSLILAFEPDLRNYSRLLQNILINGFRNIVSFNMALSNKWYLEQFFVKKAETGASGGQISQPEDETGVFECVENPVIPTVPLDDILKVFGCFSGKNPTHIKIDVDGREWFIISGGLTVMHLAKSVLIEFGSKYDTNLFRSMGFTTNNRFNEMENHSRVRRAREGIRAENVIFTREV